RVTAVRSYPLEPTKVAVCSGKNLDFVATMEHRWPVLAGNGERRWRRTEQLEANDRVIHAARWRDAPAEGAIPDAMVELVAWFWTEGSVGAGSTYGHITQSHAVNASNCERIASCFE